MLCCTSNLTTILMLLQSRRQHNTADVVWLPSGLQLNLTLTFSSSAAFQDPDGSLVDSLPLTADDVIACSGHTLESGSAQTSSSAPQRRKYYQRHFRQRSVSDANLATLHLSESQFATIRCCFFPPNVAHTPGVSMKDSLCVHRGCNGVYCLCLQES